MGTHIVLQGPHHVAPRAKRRNSCDLSTVSSNVSSVTKEKASVVAHPSEHIWTERAVLRVSDTLGTCKVLHSFTSRTKMVMTTFRWHPLGRITRATKPPSPSLGRREVMRLRHGSKGEIEPPRFSFRQK